MKGKKIRLSPENWEKIAKYIREGSCGCYFSMFDGESLKKDIEGLK